MEEKQHIGADYANLIPQSGRFEIRSIDGERTFGNTRKSWNDNIIHTLENGQKVPYFF